MNIIKLDQVFSVLKDAEKKTLIAVWANDLHSIKAISQAIDLNIINGILVGDAKEIISVCSSNNIDSTKFEIINANSDISAAAISVKMINEGKGDVLMKGLISSDKFLRAILDKEIGLLPPKTLLSHVAVIENEYYHKLLIVGDVAIIPKPNILQKITIAKNLIKTANSLGVIKPKLAIISASEQVLPSIESSVDAYEISKIEKQGEFADALIEGPLSLDAAIDKESAQIKGIVSDIAGDADCLLFPNIDAGNVFYKTNTKLSSAQTGAFVIGAKVPCVLSSRGDTTKTKLNSIALCVLLSIHANIELN